MKRRKEIADADHGALAVVPVPVRSVEEPGGKVEGGNGETGGPAGPEPTRYGDWERRGRCIDF